MVPPSSSLLCRCYDKSALIKQASSIVPWEGHAVSSVPCGVSVTAAQCTGRSVSNYNSWLEVQEQDNYANISHCQIELME